MTRRYLLLPLPWVVACLSPNPEYNRMAGASGSSGESEGSSAGSSGARGVPDSTTDETAASGSGVATTDAMDGGDTGPGTSGPPATTTSSGSSSTGWSSSSSGVRGTGSGPPLEPVDLGQPCAESDGCGELGPEVECCEAPECMDTCMVPCEATEECPFDGMGCHHGYCLFPCEGTDDDCTDWPGFTCQHGGMTFCEND